MPNNQPCRILGCLSGHLSNLAPLASNNRGYVKVPVELLLGILYQVQGSRFPKLAHPKYGRGRLSKHLHGNESNRRDRSIQYLHCEG